MAEVDSQAEARLRLRAEQCRRLAGALTDKGAAAVLLKMAEEAEADLQRIRTGDGEVPNPMPPPPVR